MKSITNKLENIQSIADINTAMQYALNSHVKDKGEKVGVLIQNWDSIRNLKQNALIHAIFQRISDATLSTGKGVRVPAVEIKAMLKDKYLGYKTIKTKSKIIYELVSTSRLTKKEFSEFIKNILEWCEKYGIEIQILAKEYDF